MQGLLAYLWVADYVAVVEASVVVDVAASNDIVVANAASYSAIIKNHIFVLK